MAKKDYYEILGMNRDASRDEIKRAYKKLAKKYHPDINKDDGAAEKFKEISEAAAVLGDDKKREQYDRFGTADTMGDQGFSNSGFSDFMSGFDSHDFDFGVLFESFFGRGPFARGGRRTRAPRRGNDLAVEVEITLGEAASGISKTINVPRLEPCKACEGTGAKGSSGIETCPECRGAGQIRMTRRMPFGMFQTTTICNRCQGEGKIITKPCSICKGRGRVKKTRKIDVKIPAGIENDMRLRLVGEGEVAEHAGEKGDLYVIVKVQSHKFFEREGQDLYCEIPISFVQATLGAEISVPTLGGNAKLKIPAGTQTNTIFRMRGKGIESINGYRAGDQLVRAIIQTPSKLSKKQKKLLQDFADASGDEMHPQKGFFKKLFG